MFCPNFRVLLLRRNSRIKGTYHTHVLRDMANAPKSPLDLLGDIDSVKINDK
jgi:hypothetical protein